MQQTIKFHCVHYKWPNIFQEQDKIKTYRFTSDVHLAHYFFPILKQCKQVTYAFKTPSPPPKVSFLLLSRDGARVGVKSAILQMLLC